MTEGKLKPGGLSSPGSRRPADMVRLCASFPRSWLQASGWPRGWALAALNRLKPYTFHIALASYWPILLYADAQAQTLAQQGALGVLTFAFLFLATRFSPRTERRRVWLMVGIATCVELFCSMLWGLYRYRWGNVPLFVPPGHGLLYLFALRAAGTPLMVNYGKIAGRVALGCGTLWAVGGLTVGPFFMGRLDVLGTLLWPIFVWFLRRPTAAVYTASFFATAELELLGTGFGNWTWAAAAPVIHLSAGNPPSVIAGAYCILDAAASKAAAFIASTKMYTRWLSRSQPEVTDEPNWSSLVVYHWRRCHVTRIYTNIEIHTPIGEVFDYATTPGNWPDWHPSSLGVSGATGHSLEPGERVTEEFRVAGRRGRVVWTVRERVAPRRWIIDGRIEGGGGGTVTYTLAPHEDGTTFEREFVYTMPNPLLALLDRLVLRRRVRAESAEALRRLKEVLERRAA